MKAIFKRTMKIFQGAEIRLEDATVSKIVVDPTDKKNDSLGNYQMLNWDRASKSARSTVYLSINYCVVRPSSVDDDSL